MDTIIWIFFAIGFAALVSGYFVRVSIFNALESDRVAASLLEDTSVFSFGDFLWVHLYRKKEQIDAQFRPKILTYFWLTISVIILWLTGFAMHWLAA